MRFPRERRRWANISRMMRPKLTVPRIRAPIKFRSRFLSCKKGLPGEDARDLAAEAIRLLEQTLEDVWYKQASRLKKKYLAEKG